MKDRGVRGFRVISPGDTEPAVQSPSGSDILERITEARNHLGLELAGHCARGDCSKAKECIEGYRRLMDYLEMEVGKRRTLS